MAAQRMLRETALPDGLPLLNVSQAAPVAAPPEGLRREMADALLGGAAAHLYGPVLGNGALRDALAARTAALYGGAVGAENVAITAGCNMAFTSALQTLAAPGDRVLLPSPWYFNHAMWLRMTGVDAVPLPTGPDLLPDPDRAAALIDARTRAVVLVTPNNPGGVEYPAALIAAFRDLARDRGLALVIDETYRDFHAAEGAPHDLLADPDWGDTVIQLYSFSKAYRLTGHRTGAIVASPARLAEVEKVLDTVQISAPQTGQIGALYGLTHLGDWLAAERVEILRRRQAAVAALDALPGWTRMGTGAYFAYLRHPLGPDGVRRMLAEQAVLALPGGMFRPPDDPSGADEVRIAFANIDAGGIAELGRRLAALEIGPARQ